MALAHNIYCSLENVDEINSNFLEIYCKIPYSEVRDIFEVPFNLTISQFIEYVNNQVRSKFKINKKFDIEIVEIDNNNKKIPNELAPCMKPNNIETLGQRYIKFYKKYHIMAFYIRPVDPISKEFTRFENYE